MFFKPTNEASKNLFALSFCALWGRFSFYGIFALLAIFLTTKGHFSDCKAYEFWGVYAVLGSALPVVGGFIGDQFLSYRRCIMLGSLGIALGNFCLMIPTESTFILGVTIFLLGMGLFKANLATLVGLVIPSSHAKKDGTYTQFFFGMVIGATLGPIVFGFCVKNGWWHLGFLINAIGTLFSLFIFKRMGIGKTIPIPNKSTYLESRLSLKKWIFPLLTPLFITAVILLFHYPHLSQYVIFALLALVSVYLVFSALKGNNSEQKRVCYLILISFFAIFYFSASLQVDGSLLLYIRRFVDHSVFGWTIPVMAFSGLEPLLIAFFIPLIAALWLYLHNKHKIYVQANTKLWMGMIITALSFFVFSLLATSKATAQFNYPLFLIFVGNFLLAFGGLFILPTVMSAVSNLAPAKLQGTLMGVWFMSSAFAGLLGDFMARLTDKHHLSKANLAGFQGAYLTISHLLLFISIFLIALSPLFNWLLKEAKK